MKIDDEFGQSRLPALDIVQAKADSDHTIQLSL
jgi:hypothetical protein